MKKRLLIVFLLGFSSGLPLSLLGSTLQAWFAVTGKSVFLTSSLTLLSLPYAYRFIWGPLLDRYTLFSIGKRRSWMLLMQILLCMGFIFLSFMSPTDMTPSIIILGFVLACTSATQDMAIEAHRTEYLLEEEYGLGASIATFGYRLALLLAGGLALVIAHYIGWSKTYQLMALCLLTGVVATCLSPEPSHQYSGPQPFHKAFIAPFKALVAKKEFAPLIGFIFFYKLGEAFTTSVSGVVMPFLIQGLGFSLDVIGYVNKIGGIGSVIIGGLIAGILLLRLSLYRALLIFGLLQALTNILFVILAIAGKNVALLVCAVILDNFAAGMGTTALVAFFMHVVDKKFTATQFSILAAISTLPRIFAGPIAGLLQHWFGWAGLYELSVVLALGFIPFLSYMQKVRNKEHSLVAQGG